jgi:hypothetical protein
VASGRDRVQIQLIFDRIFQELPSELSDHLASWTEWLTIPFLEQPAAHSRLAPFFSRAWQSSIFTALHNFLSTVFTTVSLPTLLQYGCAMVVLVP